MIRGRELKSRIAQRAILSPRCSAHVHRHLLRRRPPIVAGKFIRKMPTAAAAALWRMRLHWCASRGGFREEGKEERPSDRRHIAKPTERGESRARSITHPPLHLLGPLCQSCRGVIGDAECANCRRSTTRIYRAAAAGCPCRSRVRIKAHLKGAIVNARSIVVTTPLRPLRHPRTNRVFLFS